MTTLADYAPCDQFEMFDVAPAEQWGTLKPRPLLRARSFATPSKSTVAQLHEALVLFGTLPHPLAKTRMQKLFFLAEAHHYHKHGETAFDLHFFSYKHGPYTTELYPYDIPLRKSIEQDKGRIEIVDKRPLFIGIKSKPGAEAHLPDDILDTCREVMNTYGELPLSALLNVVYSLVYYQCAAFGSPLFFEGWPKETILEYLPDGARVETSLDKFKEVSRLLPGGWKETDEASPILPSEAELALLAV